MASRLSEVVRSWQEATGGGLNHIQTRELLRALEAQEAAVDRLAAAFGTGGESRG